MNLFDRPRSPLRRVGILAWMLLVACACAPLASALQPPARTVVVPFCSARDGTGGRHAPQPRRIALCFSAVTASGAPLAFAPPALSVRGPAHAACDARLALAPCVAPMASPISRLPPPRAPPGAATPS